MPTYVYQCRKCDGRFEKVQRITAKPLTKCELDGCDGEVFRVIQPVSISFKGSGFHINDYGRNGAKRDGKPKFDSDSTSDSKAESKTVAKAESKSETKSESKPDKKSKSEAAA